MKRLILMILAACAGALVAWRVTRYQEPAPLELEDLDEPGSWADRA
ncbi:MAG TPA: hypothetical protein VN771_07215 [Candidatus Baltobacteraceae bacterium]|jgi:hypothetical protein|nr:hypothetical protein [Candidatus Baltobacteraceae bacterium]